MAGIALAQHQGWNDTVAVEETYALDDTTAFDESADVSNLLNYIFNTTSALKYYELVGSWESAPIDLSEVGRIQNSAIVWTATIPEGCFLSVYTSLYDGTWWQAWQPVAANGSQVSGLTLEQNAGRNIAGCKLRIKVEAYTTDVTKTPNLTQLIVTINSRKIFRIMPDGAVKARGAITQNASESL